jgi:hypothetical protein
MTQIKQTKIIVEQDVPFPATVSLPRDLLVNPNRSWEKTSGINALPQDLVTLPGETSNEGISSPGDQHPPFVPATPLILSVKSQQVTFKPDGTATIDVILDVQDVPGVVEYDIRISKNAGNL